MNVKLLVLLNTAVLLFGGRSFYPQTSSAAEDTRVTRWREDLNFLETKFSSGQLDFGKLYPDGSFQKEIAAVAADVPQISDAEIVLRLMRLVAAAGVAHNTVFLPTGALAFHRLPVWLAWYSDGLFVVRASDEYSRALGARVVSIGSQTPEQLEQRIPKFRKAENINMIVAGGEAGKFSAVFAGWVSGPMGSSSVSREIEEV